MPSIKFIIDCEVDGQRIFPFPLIRRIQANEIQQFNVTRASGGGYVATPTSDLASLKALCLLSDQAVTVRLNAQSDAGIPLNAGGFLLVLDATISAGASTNATVDNSSGADTQLQGVAVG